MGAPTGVDVEAMRAENEQLRKEREELRSTIEELNGRVRDQPLSLRRAASPPTLVVLVSATLTPCPLPRFPRAAPGGGRRELSDLPPGLFASGCFKVQFLKSQRPASQAGFQFGQFYRCFLLGGGGGSGQ